jgi:predicted MFS family arabinose efflux permease
MINPMMTEFGWPNSLASSSATAYNLAGLLAAPGLGVCLDKFGARPLMTFGVLSTSVGFLLASRCQTHYEMLMAFSCVGIGNIASLYVPTAVIIANWMEEKKGLGMGIVWGATSMGAAAFSLLIGWWIEACGWRVTSKMVAALVVTMLPITVMLMRTSPPRVAPPHDRLPDGGKRHPAGRGLLLSRVFMIGTATSALFAVGMCAIYYHVVPVMIKAGYQTHWAGCVFAASWVLSGLGSVVLGSIASRFAAKSLLAGALLVSASGTVFLLGAGEARIGIVCVVAFVTLWGSSANSVNQFIPVIFAERFGPQKLGILIGVQSSIVGIASAAAPIVTGLLYDRLGDYRVAIWLSASATVLALAMASLIDVPERACDTDLREVREYH